MSLLVRLPLNGNLNNYGSADVTVTNNGATISNDGKLGKCYSFDGNDDYISISSSTINTLLSGTNPFTISMWTYHADATRAILFGDYGTSGTINFNIELNTSHQVRFYWGGDPDWTATSKNIGINTWSHIAIIYDTTQLSLYINGELSNTRSGVLSTKNKTSGSFCLGRDSRTGTTALNGRLNDFRIYDNALTESEIKHLIRGKGLQLWMPLTKDLRQQGLSGITPTQTTGYASITDGKLGGCYKFTGTFDTLLPLSSWDWTTGSVSFGCWAKISKTELNALATVPSYTSTYRTMGGTLLGRDSYGGVSIRWGTNDIYTDGSLNKIYVFTHMRNTSSVTNQTSSYEVPFDTWFHVMTVIDRDDSKIKLYVNGELVNTVGITATGAFSTGTFRIAESSWHGGNGNSSSGCWQLNDVRVYDYALNEKEIKEISKGLVLHYTLSNKYIESTTNLITTEDCLSSTCYNGATSKYSYGTTTDMYKTVTTFDGRKGTKVYMGTDGNSCYPYVYVNNMFTSDGTNQPAYKTLSFDYYTTISTSISPYKLGSGSGTATYIVSNKNGVSTGTGTNSVVIPVVPNTWNHVEITFHGTTAANSEWGYIQNIPKHVSDTSNFWFFANMQLEVNDHATGYAGVGGIRNSNIVYDCSGYCNNGTISGALSLSDDTPKYQRSTVFNGTQRIEAPWNPSGTTSFSVSGWFYHSGGTTYYAAKDTYNTYIDLEGSRYFVYNSSASPYVGNWTSVANTWQHIVLVHDATATKLKLYINGNFVSEVTTNGTVYNSDILDIGGRQGVAQYSGKMSDFRIYATALSAEDIQALYQAGVS